MAYRIFRSSTLGFMGRLRKEFRRRLDIKVGSSHPAVVLPANDLLAVQPEGLFNLPFVTSLSALQPLFLLKTIIAQVPVLAKRTNSEDVIPIFARSAASHPTTASSAP